MFTRRTRHQIHQIRRKKKEIHFRESTKSVELRSTPDDVCAPMEALKWHSLAKSLAKNLPMLCNSIFMRVREILRWWMRGRNSFSPFSSSGVFSSLPSAYYSSPSIDVFISKITRFCSRCPFTIAEIVFMCRIAIYEIDSETNNIAIFSHPWVIYIYSIQKEKNITRPV